MEKVDNSGATQSFADSGAHLVVFAKEPVAGEVKTRLAPPLSMNEASDLYRVALDETVARLSRAGLPMTLCFSGRERWFRKAYPETALWPQSEGGLGERLVVATRHFFSRGCAPLLLVGSDSPDLPVEQIRVALDLLQQFDVVTMPCADGGYALIGLRQPEVAIFEGIPWSTGRVLTATRERAAELGLRYVEVTGWDDLDDLAALRRFLKRSPQTDTAEFIRTHLGHYLVDVPAG